MEQKYKLTKEQIELKYRVMSKRLAKLSDMLEIIGKEPEATKIKEITTEYSNKYDELIKAEDYDNYYELEDWLIKEAAGIELVLDEFITSTAKNYEEIIKEMLGKMEDSRAYKYFEDLDSILKGIKNLKELNKLYIPFVGAKRVEAIEGIISRLKFNTLWRMQAKGLMCLSDEAKSWGAYPEYLSQYDDEKEKERFIELIEEKINGLGMSEEEIKATFGDSEIINDDMLKGDTYRTCRELDTLLNLDMDLNPKDYIGLLNAKIFNPHLCNIDPRQDLSNQRNKFPLYVGVGLTPKIRFSILYAVLKYMIKDEDTSIIECEKIYRKFGFKCMPILFNKRQERVCKLLEQIRGTKEYEEMAKKPKVEKGGEKRYSTAPFMQLDYYYSAYNEKSYDILSLSDEQLVRQAEERIEKLEGMHRINLINSLQDSRNDGVLEGEKNQSAENKASRVKESIDRLTDFIKELEIYEQYPNTYRRERLRARYKILTELNTDLLNWTGFDTSDIRVTQINCWRILPLEDMVDKRTVSQGVYNKECLRRHLIPVFTMDHYAAGHYKTIFEELGLDIIRYKYFAGSIRIAVNLDEISDLPLDYEKINIVTEEGLKEIIANCEKYEEER